MHPKLFVIFLLMYYIGPWALGPLEQSLEFEFVKGGQEDLGRQPTQTQQVHPIQIF